MSIRPENYDEIEACVAIVWGEEGRDCHTKLAIRNKCEQTIREMRDYGREEQERKNAQEYLDAYTRWPVDTARVGDSWKCALSSCDDRFTSGEDYITHLKNQHGFADHGTTTGVVR